MKNVYEIRIRKYMIDDKWLWKIRLSNFEGETFVDIGLESTMDKAYEVAKKKFDELTK